MRYEVTLSGQNQESEFYCACLNCANIALKKDPGASAIPAATAYDCEFNFDGCELFK